MKTSIIALAVVISVTVMSSAQTTQRLSAGKSNEYGLGYTLPMTTFDIVIAAEKTERLPGEFARYSQRYLHLDPILEPSVEWKVTGAEILPRATADNGERYLVQFKNGSAPFMHLTQEGFPVSVNDDDYVPAAAPQTKLSDVPAAPSALEVPAARQAVTEEMLRSHSSAKRAELAAARIYEIRRQRSEIISGEAESMPSDGDAMRLALDNLEAQEAALTAMFTGTVKRSVSTATYTVIPPDSASVGKADVVARLSATEGLVDPDDLSGSPIYLTVSDVVAAELPVNEKGQQKTFHKGGLAYRIPGQATLTLSDGLRTLASLQADVAQYGAVFGLDPGLFTDRKAPAYLRFFPLTGAVSELGTITSKQ